MTKCAVEGCNAEAVVCDTHAYQQRVIRELMAERDLWRALYRANNPEPAPPASEAPKRDGAGDSTLPCRGADCGTCHLTGGKS